MRPLIRASHLTQPPRYYVLTRYRLDGNAVVASTKYDVTDQIEALILAARPAADPAGLATAMREHRDNPWHRDWLPERADGPCDDECAFDIAARLSVADGPGGPS